MGLGGHLMWTPVVKALHEKHGVKVYLENNEGEGLIWKKNPYITLNRTRDAYALDIKEVSYAVSSSKHTGISQFIEYNGHIINHYLEHFELPALEDLKCELFFDGDEEKNIDQLVSDLSDNFIVIEPNSKLSYTPNRQYPIPKWQEVVNKIFNDVQVVQTGIGGPVLKNVTNLTGKTTFRANVLLIKYAKAFISSEGGLVHGATCVDTPSVVPINSYIPQTLVRYPQNTYISSSSHSPCGSYKECQRCLKEMNSITPESIIEAVKEILNK